MISAQGQTIRISMKELRVMGRNTQGVNLANLRAGDSLLAIQKIVGEENEEEEIDGLNSSLTSSEKQELEKQETSLKKESENENLVD